MDLFSQFFSATPSIAFVQYGLAAVAVLLVFLVLFTTRDVLLRADSFPYQLVCIVLVAALPVVGFLTYLLVRPARTRKERQMERDIAAVLARFKAPAPQPQQHHHQQKKKGGHTSQAPGFKMTAAKTRP